MQFLKKVISLILVVAMVSSFALVASADSPNILVELYDSDGQALASGSTVQTGDTIKVRLKTTENRVISTLKTFIAYDSELLKCTGATLTDIKNYFTDARFNCNTQVLDRQDDPEVSGFAVGTPIVIGQWVCENRMDPIPANSDWIEYTFTALKAGTAELRLAVMEAEEMPADSLDSFSIMDQLITQGATVKITAAPVAVESVNVSPASITLNPNGTQQLTATVSPAEATETVTWHSENGEVATVSDTGLVTAVGVGDTTITATAGEKSGSCAVKVEAADVITKFEARDGIEVYGKVGSTTSAYIAYETSDGSTPDIKWTTDDAAVAPIGRVTTANGESRCRVKSTKEGVAHVTATAGSHSVTFTYHTYTEIADSVSISTNEDLSFSFPVGKTIQFTATVSPDTYTATWMSSKPSVATVDGNGLVTTVGAGTAVITAVAQGKTAKQAITVVDLGDGNYTVALPEEETQKVKNNQTVTLPITIEGTNGTDSFNAFDMTLSFDSDKLEPVMTIADIENCQVGVDGNKLHITRFGKTLNAPVVLNLQFNVKMTEGSADVVLNSAQVDMSDHALDMNAPNASKLRATTTLEIAENHTVVLPDTMESAQGNSVADGDDYTFSIKDGVKDDYHDYTVSAKMGGEDTVVTENENGSYTVKNVTGDLVITMTANPKTFLVNLIGQDVKGDNSATYGTDYDFTITEQEGYTYEVAVTIGGKPYTVAAVSGKYTIPGSDVTGDIVITVTKKDSTGAVIYTVTKEGNGAEDVTADATAKKGEAFAFKLTPADRYIYTVEVTVNGSMKQPAIAENSDDTKTYTIAAADVTGNIRIRVVKDEAVKVTFDIADPSNISVKNAAALVKKGDSYEFTVDRFFMVYTLNCEVTEGGNAKAATETVSGNDATRRDHKFVIANVQDDLNIKLSWVANDEYVNVVVKDYVNLDGKTVFMVAACTKNGNSRALKFDTYDGHPMYSTKLYKETIFPDSPSDADVFLWLTVEDNAFGVDQALKKLSYGNPQKGVSTYFPESLKDNADVNQSGLIDINDAQLVFDIYNGTYQTFYRTNTNSAGAHEDPNYGVGASMNKFLEADINRDMTVDVKDAAAVVAKIK